jgi:hypothetical protein
LLPLSGNRILGLASHEYSGWRHPGNCSNMVPRPSCWYLSLVATIADGGSRIFRLLPRDRRVIAASQTAFDRTSGNEGFLTLSNIVYSTDTEYDPNSKWAYFVAWTEGRADKGGRGNCLFRTRRSDPIEGWQALTADGYARMSSAYDIQADNDARCLKIGSNELIGKVRSLVWLEQRKLWLAVYSTRNVRTVDQTLQDGVFISTSRDLIVWTPPRLLAALEPPWGSKRCGVYYDYPSIIDHQSRDALFQTVAGEAYLYVTRLNWTNCKPSMNRDLIRFKLGIR